MKENTADIVTRLIEPYAAELGLDIYDVEFVKEGSEHYLRVYIDKTDGVSVDDCETLSRAIDPVLDEADPISESYYLEVSSVGLDRPLRLPKDFERFMGTDIDIRLFKPINGARELCGRLCGYSDGQVSVKCADGEQTINVKDASLIRPHIDF